MQNTVTSSSDITTGTISSGNITGRTSTTITAPTITSSGNLFYGTTNNVATNISSIETSLNAKQDILTYNNDLVLNSIVVKPRFTKGVYTEALDGEIRASILSIEDTITGETINVKDTLDSKQNMLIAGDNITITNSIISSTGGGSGEDRDRFHYSGPSSLVTVTTSADIPWTTVRRGSSIIDGNSFRAKYSGLYAITIQNILTTGSSGGLRVGV
jgi:hypothetical protein